MDPVHLSHVDLLGAIRREGSALADVIDAAPPDAAVPSCPGWTVRDLHGHVAGVLRFWVTAIEHPELERDEIRALTARIAAEAPERLRASLDALVAAIEARRPSDPAWGWSSNHSVAFVTRRSAHELTMHRVDAELASGKARPIDAVLASDGIDEYMVQIIGTRRPTNPEPIGGSVHVHCTDVAGEWMVRETDAGLVVTREHAKGDVAARGAANDVLLALWHRQDLSTLEVIGDESVLRRFTARLSI